MSQFGMQLPGGQMRRGPQMNIYTGLLAFAVLALAAAAIFLFIAGGRIGKDGSPFGLQPAPGGSDRIQFAGN